VARLYANENFPLPVVEALRGLGHDVLTTHEAGRSGESIPDDQVLAFAVTDRRALLTLNRKDFVRLHQRNSNHHGMIVCTVDENFARQADRIHTAISEYESLDGQLIRVNRPPR